MVDDFTPGYPIDLRSRVVVAREAAGPYGDFEWRAARVVARATGLRTTIQDDNRTPRTPDLRVEDGDELIGVAEVVITADGGRADQLRAFTRGQLEFDSPNLQSTWWVTVTSRARRAGLRQRLIKAFSELEKRGDHEKVDGRQDRYERMPELIELERHGLTEVYCDPTPRDGPGRIYGLPEGIGGTVQVDWLACANWIDQFLRTPLCGRKVAKVADASAAEGHLYVGITGGDPWPVHQALENSLIEVPLPPPSLPAGLTHLWFDNAEFPSRVISWWPDRGWFDVRTRWKTE